MGKFKRYIRLTRKPSKVTLMVLKNILFNLAAQGKARNNSKKGEKPQILTSSQ